MEKWRKKLKQSIFDMTTICRCCRVMDGVRILLTSYFNTKDKTYRVDEMYSSCIDNQVVVEGYPKYICVNCLQELINAYEFKKKCFESNSWFEKNNQKNLYQPSSAKKLKTLEKNQNHEKNEFLQKNCKILINQSIENVTKNALMDHDYIKIKKNTQNQDDFSNLNNKNLENSATSKSKTNLITEDYTKNVEETSSDWDFEKYSKLKKNKRQELEDKRANIIVNSLLKNHENGIMNFETNLSQPIQIKDEIKQETNSENSNFNEIWKDYFEENLINFDSKIDKILEIDNLNNIEAENQNISENEISNIEKNNFPNIKNPNICQFKNITSKLETQNLDPNVENVTKKSVGKNSLFKKKVVKNSQINLVMPKSSVPNLENGGTIKILLKEDKLSQDNIKSIVKQINQYKGGAPLGSNIIEKNPEVFEILEVKENDNKAKYGERDENDYYTCYICGKKVKDVRKHIQIHTSVKNYKCKVCDKAFLRSHHLKSHVLIHAGIKNFACDTCDRKFVTKESLRNHEKRHSGIKPHLCSYCGKSFALKGGLVAHVRGHTGEKPLKCTYKDCNKSFSGHTSLKLHLLIHSGEKPELCQYCGKSFKMKSQLRVHVRIHTGEKPYPCTYCERSFRTNGLRIIHTRAAHTGERPYSCEICKKSFYSKGKLNGHKQIHTKDEKYCCKLCDAKFRTKGTFNDHLMSHNDYKKYECQICDIKFAKKRELKDHFKNVHPELVQENTTKYICRVCGTDFQSIAVLNEHTILHGPENYTCQYCYKIFTNPGGLARHITRLHTEEADYRESDSNSEENNSSSNSESDDDS